MNNVAEPVTRLQGSAPSAQPLAPGQFVPISGGFDLWSQGVLRSSGFPIAGLLALSDAEYAAAVDRFVDQPDDGTRQDLVEAAARGATRQAALLSQIARRADFLEAVTWQNPDLVAPMIVALGQMGADAPKNQRLRKRQRIVAKYWARFCAKNETIGFFGPVSWFSFRADGEPLRMKAGPALVRRSELYLEPWSIDALAASLVSDPEIRAWVAPRRNPTVYLLGTTVHTQGGSVELDDDEARLLALVDGSRRPVDIAAEYGAELVEVHSGLERLADKELLFWDLEPPLVQRAERELRRRLESIGDTEIRARATGALDRLEAARDALAGYRDPGELRQLNEGLEREFTSLTGVDPARRPGQAYGGRRLAYVECTRDVDLSFGPQVLRSFADPLALLLTSARWLVHESVERTRALQLKAFDAMGVDSVNFLFLVFSNAETFMTPGARAQDQVVREFVGNWRSILGMDSSDAVVAHRSDTLRPLVEAAFPGCSGADLRPGAAFAHTHSFDLHIAARGPEAFARGEFQPVIGEFHIAACPFETPVFGWAHPDLEELRAMLAAVIPDRRVMLSPVKDYPRVTARTYPWTNDARGWRLCVSHFPPRDDRLLPLYGLRAHREGDRLMVGLPGAPEQFEAMDIGGAWMAWDLVDVFKQVTRGYGHNPRVVVDDLVVFRETWSFPVLELDWIHARSDADTFVAARRWLRARALPETVFAAISSETKPVFVDFRSEVQVANLAQLLRTGAQTEGSSVSFSEMLPAPEQSWLADAEGNVYTSELRLVFRDAMLANE